MKRCWLHIGMPKTGSSSIQNTLGSIRNPKGWTLLKAGRKSNMGIALYAMFHHEPHNLHWFVKLGKTASEIEEMGSKLREELIQKLNNTQTDCTIVSGELLWIFSIESLNTLKLFLSPFFDEIKVIGYVRPPMSYYNSILQQQFKSGKSDLETHHLKINYRSKIEKFDQVFGATNVTVVKFKPNNFTNNCIVEDFCERLQIKLPNNTSIIRSNESLSLEACGLLYAYRKFGPGYGIGPDAIKENTFIIRPLRMLKGEKFTLSKSLLENNCLIDEIDTQWLEKRIGDSFYENYNDSEHATSSEDELLLIQRRTLVQFSELFSLVWKISLPITTIPSGSFLEPTEVANYMHLCRELMAAKLKKKRARNQKNPAFKLVRLCLNLKTVWLRHRDRKIKRPDQGYLGSND